MKTTLTLICSLFLTASMFAQCVANVTDFGNNNSIPMYNISGEVMVTLNAGATSITLDLGNDFMTAAGPDIRAYLVNPGTLTDEQLTNTPIANLENIQFGLVGSGTVNQNGAKTFTVDIPVGVDISAYSKVFFYCLQFNQFWDFGTFEAFNANNCGVLSTQDEILNTIEFSPNPASEIITINNSELAPVHVSIYSILGQQSVLETKLLNTTQTLDISPLAAGIYLMDVTLGNRKVVHKIIKE